MKKLLLFTAVLTCSFQLLTFNSSAQTAITASMQEIGRSPLTIGQLNKTPNAHPLPSQNNNTRAINSLVQLNDSTKNWSWDTLSFGWSNHPYQKTINIVYDSHNNLTSELIQQWDSSAWMNSGNYIYTYDSNNNQTSYLIQNWVNGAWVDIYQYVYTYDANNNKTSKLYQHWNGTTWVPYSKYIYTFNSNNKVTNQLYQTGSALVNNQQFIYTYDANNNNFNVLSQSWVNNAWINNQQSTYTYDVNHNRISGITQTWFNSAWLNYSQYTRTFNGNNDILGDLSQTWLNSAWVNSHKSTYTYNGNNYILNYLGQILYTGVWVNNYQYSYIYDANNIEKSYEYKMWNSAGIKITGGDSTYYYFHTVTVTGINDLAAQEGNITIYPNPFNQQTTISFSEVQKNTSIKIMDVLGKEIKTIMLSGAKSLILEKGEMNSGIYFVQIIDENKNVVNRKILLQ